MSELKRSVAGIRGIWGDTLTPAIATEYATAFGIYVKSGKIVVGSDTRTTREPLKLATVAGLLAAGCEVVDIGICPTPTCQLMVKTSDVAGGIVITASHNPGEWNGLKFLSAAGEFLNESSNQRFLDIIDQHQIKYEIIPNPPVYQHGAVYNTQAIQLHLDKICKYIDLETIRQKKYKVVLDACNGAGSALLIPLLEKMGAEIVQLNCKANGHFPRGAEPMPENLTELCTLVKSANADIGFAVDPDADRLSIVSDEGIALGEEMTLPLVAQHVLQKKQGVVVTNLSTSMAIDFVAKKFNTRVIRTKIGEANVVSGMKATDCVIGGEGNGGIIVPDVQYARDTGIGTGIIMELLAVSGKKISELARTIPALYLVKKKIEVPLDQIPTIYAHFEKKYRSEHVDTTDGVKVVWDESWIHLRKSGTEGLLRIFAEAMTPEKATAMVDKALEEVREMI